MENLLETSELLSDITDIDQDEIYDLLNTLHAPPGATRLLLVLQNLQIALESTRTLFSLFANDDFVHLFDLEIVRRLIQSLGQPSPKKRPTQWFDQSSRRQGIINDHPEWAMLILPQSHNRYRDTLYRQHQSVVIQCAALQRKRHSSVGSEILTACRDMRQLTSDVLFELHPQMSLFDYQDRLYTDESTIVPELRGIELLVRRINKNTGKTREGGESRHVQGVESEVRKADPEDPQNQGPISELHMLQSGLTGDDAQHARTSGLHPKEFQSLSAVAVHFSEKSATAGFDLKDHYRRQSKQVKHLGTANQRLPFRYASLSTIELSAAAKGAFELFVGIGPFHGRSHEGMLAGLLLMLLIWLGRPIEELLKIRVYPDRSLLPQTRKSLLAYLAADRCFAIPIPAAEWRNNLTESARQLLYDIGGAEPAHSDDVIIVACPVRITTHLEAIDHQTEKKKRTNYTELFPASDHEQIRNELSQALSTLNRKNSLRLTSLRVSQALFDEITALSSDWTEAYLLTGHSFTVTEVTAHYTSVSGDYLQKLYHQAVTSMRDRLYQYLGIAANDFYKFEQSVSNPGDHGSKLNPKPLLIQRLIGHLKHEIREAKRGPPGEEQWRRTHNTLVAYTAFWILFSTGYRAVNDLVFRLREIDWTTGFLVISDKDDESLSNSRTIWLQPELLNQLTIYTLHLEVLQMRIRNRQTLIDHIEEILSNPIPDASLFFFISDSWQLTQVSPENLRKQVPEFALPLNLGRHYLRSALRARGCPAEYVNAFMGHWQKGQEPFGRFSAMTPFELFQELAPHLEGLSREAGWTRTSGLADE